MRRWCWKARREIEVVSEMQVIFDYGNASFHVPESAVGFQVDTRYGNIVDHGTRFSLSLGEESNEARLAVREGEIAIHHSSGEVKHLFTDETARIDEKQLQSGQRPGRGGRAGCQRTGRDPQYGWSGDVDHLQRSISEEPTQSGVSDGQIRMKPIRLL